METQNLMKIIISLVVGVVLFSAILVPSVGTALVTAGDEITKTNASPTNQYCDYYTDDVTIVFDSPDGSTTNATTTITIGDYSTDMSTVGISEILFVGDTFYIQLSAYGSTSMGIIRGAYDGNVLNANLNLGYKYTLEYDASEELVTLTSLNNNTSVEATVFEVTSSVFFAIKEDGAYSLTRETYSSGQYAYANMAIDMDNVSNGTLGVLTSTYGMTIDGQSITVIYTVTTAGVQALSYTEGYTVTGTVAVSGDLTLVDGTTDIYTGGTPVITLTITNDTTQESVTSTTTPEAAYILREVDGHADSGANYSLISIIPLLVLVGLVLGAIGSLIARRD